MHLDLHFSCKDWELRRVLSEQRRPGRTGETNSGNKLPTKISENTDLNFQGQHFVVIAFLILNKFSFTSIDPVGLSVTGLFSPLPPQLYKLQAPENLHPLLV